MEKIETLILGGGISAVAFAHFYKLNSYLILEKENSLGGLCRSFRVGNSIFDYSGHFLHFNNPEMEDYVKTLVDRHQTGEFKLFDRKAGIFMQQEYRNKIIDYPFQANIHQLEKEDFIRCFVDLYNAQKHVSKTPVTFEDLVLSTFGKSLTDIFFKPYNEKLYRTPLYKLDADAMKRFIPKLSLDEIVQNFREQKEFGYNSKFLYSPTSGIQGLVDAFVHERQPNVSLNETILHIDIEGKVVTTDKRQIEYTTLINTLPLPLFAELSDAQSLALKSVDVTVYNITYTQKVALPRDKKAWLYFPGNSSLYRVGFYDYMSGKDKTSIYVEVSSPMGIENNKTLSDIDDELKDLGVIHRDAIIEESQILHISPAYAILENETFEKVSKYRIWLQEHGVYLTGRYANWTYSSIEDAIIEAKQLAIELSTNY